MPKCPQDPEFLVGSHGALPFSLCNQHSSFSLFTGFSNQGLVGEAVCGQWPLEGDHVHALLPPALHQPHHLQVLLAAGTLRQGFPPASPRGWLGEVTMASPWAAETTSIPAPSREKRLQPMGCLARLRAFFTAPIIIFLMNILSYFTFLLLFAYVLMVDFQPEPSWREYLIYFWLFSLVCEETRQVWAGRAEPGRWHRGGEPLWVLLGAPTQLMSPRCSSCHHLFREASAHGTTRFLISDHQGFLLGCVWLGPVYLQKKMLLSWWAFPRSRLVFGNVRRWRELFLWVNSQQDFQVLLDI